MYSQLSSLLVVAIAILAASHLAGAEKCKISAGPSITSLDVNAKALGHVYGHVVSPGPISDVSHSTAKKGKSMFKSYTEFSTAWTNWVADSAGVDCGGLAVNGKVVDCRPIAGLGLTRLAICKTVVSGICTVVEAADEAAKSVMFVYKNVGGGKIILLTSYPMVKDC